MSNNLYLVSHYDERRGTNWAGVDEDRILRETKVNAYDRFGPREWNDWFREHAPWLLPVLVIDHTDNDRVVDILRRYSEKDPFADDENRIIARWREQMVPYPYGSKAMEWEHPPVMAIGQDDVAGSLRA